MPNNYNLPSYILFLLAWLLTTTVAHANERILALAPHICETLYAIGAGKDIVGGVSYCDYPAAAKDLPRIGAYNRINVEAAISLKPTLAIALNPQTPGLDKLRALGVKVVSSYPLTVDEVISETRRLGKLTNHQQQANQVADAMQKRLNRLKQRVSKQNIPVFYEIWADPLLTAGNNTFIHDVLKQIGLRNVFGSVALEAPRVNVESVINAKPKLIIIPSEKRDISVRSAYWRKWLGDDIAIITVNPDLVHRPGPRLLDGMEYLVNQIEGLDL
ncbi:MAG: helical backbone metal receptor [Ghiorsea sp.]|nr:helical backbone metal receptor [Ghiorsea sp.]